MGSGNVGCELELKQLITDISDDSSEEIEVNFHNPSIVTLRFDPEAPAVTAYRTGSFQIRGTKSESQLKRRKMSF